VGHDGVGSSCALTSPTMRLGLVYLPSPKISDLCVRYAASLVNDLSPRVVVGAQALPHLSLLHAETDRSPDSLFAEARTAIPAYCTFDVVSLGLLRYDTPYNAPPAPVLDRRGSAPSTPATMAWLMVPCSEALRSAERAAMELPGLSGVPITTGNGDDFQPHLTIAMWEGHTPPTTFEPAELIPKKGIQGTLALGAIGPNGVYTHTLVSC
jgi:hypothetical protein